MPRILTTATLVGPKVGTAVICGHRACGKGAIKVLTATGA